jgi:hypothetical protein
MLGRAPLWYRRGSMRSLIRFALDRFPYIGSLRAQIRAAGSYPPGHFYSAVPSQEDVAVYLASRRSGDPVGVELNRQQQYELLQAFGNYYADLPFSEHPGSQTRYYYDQSTFCYADAIFLYSFLRHFQPRRIVEVGSGFSSAAMLDTAEQFLSPPPHITLIEPYADALKQLLRPEDLRTVTIVQEKVQDVPLEQFATLEAGDLLFVDSSHVLKCGSDLQFLLFEVVPRLRVGVFVHFHDVFAGFEYPDDWLRKGMFWNEDYLLRAFLSFNYAWEITLFGNFAVGVYRDWLAAHMPLCLENPGGSLYLRRVR